jgi:hypothetical protein
MALKQTPASGRSIPPLAFALVAGIFLFLAIVKLGDPVILDRETPPPASAAEAYYLSWPSKWGYLMLIPLLVAGLLAIPWNRLKFRSILALPAVWLGWEFIASAQSVSPELTRETMAHFTVCVALFYLGYFALQGTSKYWPSWAGIALALCWVIHSGVEQHFGGL